MPDIPQLLERFRRGPEVVAVALTGVFGEAEDFEPAPGKWSVRQIIAHLADCELVFAHRLRQVIAEDNPTLVAFDQNAWAAHLDYSRRKPRQSLESLRRLRAENYDLLKELPETAFARTGNHTERGAVSLVQLLESAANHTENHARQIDRIRETYKTARNAR